MGIFNIGKKDMFTLLVCDNKDDENDECYGKFNVYNRIYEAKEKVKTEGEILDNKIAKRIDEDGNILYYNVGCITQNKMKDNVKGICYIIHD